jgi:hypothetical protein
MIIMVLCKVNGVKKRFFSCADLGQVVGTIVDSSRIFL